MVFFVSPFVSSYCESYAPEFLLSGDRLHTLWNLVMIVLLSVCQLASQRKILPSKLWSQIFFLSNMKNLISFLSVMLALTCIALLSMFRFCYWAKYPLCVHLFDFWPGFPQSYVEHTCANAIRILMLIWTCTTNSNIEFATIPYRSPAVKALSDEVSQNKPRVL